MLLHEFLGWFTEAPIDQRVQALNNLVDCCYRPHGDAHPHCLLNDRDEAETALTLILDDKHVEVRKAVATAIAPLANAPEALVLTLANDVDEVAEIVLGSSPVLIEAELAARLETASPSLEVAIARREDLPETMMEQIAATGSEAACLALAANLWTDVPGPVLLKLLARFGPTPALRKALTESGRLSEAAHSPFAPSNDDRALVRFDPRAGAAADQQALAEWTTLALMRNCTSTEVPEVVADFIAGDRITTTLMLRALVVSELEFLIHAYAQLSGLPLRRVQALLGGSRVLGYAALHQKAGLPATTRSIFAIGLDVQADAARYGWESRIDQDSLICAEMLKRYSTSGSCDKEVLTFLRALNVELARRAARNRLQAKVEATAALPEPQLLLAAPTTEIAQDSPDNDPQQLMETELAEALATELLAEDNDNLQRATAEVFDLAELDGAAVEEALEAAIEATATGEAGERAVAIQQADAPDDAARQLAEALAVRQDEALETPFDDFVGEPSDAVVSQDALTAMAAELQADLDLRTREKSAA